VRQVIDDGTDGLLVPFGNPATLADALALLADSPEMRRAMGIAGRRKVEAQFTWSRVFDKIDSAFGRVLGIRVKSGKEPPRDERACS
jgi:glycosyltransferase involved in cell wall biosynthesis